MPAASCPTFHAIFFTFRTGLVAGVMAWGLAACQIDRATSNASASSTSNAPLGAASPSTNGSGTTTINGTRFIGRVAPSSNLLSWSGSGFAANFSGTGGTIAVTTQTGHSYLGISIDNNTTFARVDAAGNQPIEVGPVPAGNHTLTVVKLNEAELGVLAFQSFTPAGSFKSQNAPSRRIEFIGDSITLGYGVDGVSPCTNSAAVENATESFAWLTAKRLAADASLIAWSGRGVYRNTVGTTETTTMSTIWTRYNAADASSAYDFPSSAAADAVVINLGTNDYAYVGYDASGNSYSARPALDQNAFIQAYVGLVTDVHARYPKAPIFLMNSPMVSDSYPTAADQQHTNLLNNLNAIAAQVPDATIKVVDIPTMNVGNGINGCDSHPSASEHVTMSGLLVPHIQQALSW